MEAKRSRDFIPASRGSHLQTEHLATAKFGESDSSTATPYLPGEGKPVASVRPSVTTRRSQTPGAQPVIAFERLLDLREASAVLGMHWKTLEAKARGHEVPALKVGKRWRFRLSSLDSWLERGINSNTTDHAVVTGQERCS